MENNPGIAMLMATAMMTKLAMRKQQEIKDTGTYTMSEEDKMEQQRELQEANEEMLRAPRAYRRRLLKANKGIKL